MVIERNSTLFFFLEDDFKYIEHRTFKVPMDCTDIRDCLNFRNGIGEVEGIACTGCLSCDIDDMTAVLHVSEGVWVSPSRARDMACTSWVHRVFVCLFPTPPLKRGVEDHSSRNFGLQGLQSQSWPALKKKFKEQRVLIGRQLIKHVKHVKIDTRSSWGPGLPSQLFGCRNTVTMS